MQPVITRSQSVSVNLTDDCRELGGNAAESSEVQGLGSGVHRNRALAGHDTFDWRVKNSGQSCRSSNRSAVMRGLGQTEE